jgi:hypothetical protein
MAKLVSTVTLRNRYQVLQDSGGDYIVAHKDQRGASFTQDVEAAVVQNVFRRFTGSTVTVSDVDIFLAREPKALRGPYDYGHKLYFYAQAVLLILAATRRARRIKSGRRFEYQIFLLQRRARRATQNRGASTMRANRRKAK